MVSVDGHDGSHRSGKVLVAALIGGAVLVGGYFAVGMPGMDHTASSGATGSAASMDHESMAAMRLDPDAFAARLGDPAAFVVNVHTPYEGELAGTDAFIPYDRVATDSRLPADKDAEILLYCRSGRMSQTAAEALRRAGYTNVVELAGGMNAWETAGMAVHMSSPAG